MTAGPKKTGLRLAPLPPRAAAISDPTKAPRLHALDALRGIFSIDVIFAHFYVTLPTPMQYQDIWLLFTPIRLVPAIVITFFMLSGFVLALPYETPAPPRYRTFLIKRVCRIYIPFAFIMLLAFVLDALTGTDRQAINDMTFHMQGLAEPGAFTLPLLGRVLLMTGLRSDNLLDPAMWSLVQEMRVSLIFPLLVILCRRPWIGFPFMVACYVFVALTQNSIGHYAVFPALSDDYPTIWLTTVYVIPCFMCGVFLAKYKNSILGFLSECSTLTRAILWFLVLVNFCFMTDFEIRQPFTEFGSALLLMLVLSSETIDQVATAPVLQWLGRISYSVYLVHLPILFALRHCFEGRLALGWALALCFVLTFPVATLIYRFIELPARKLAKKWVAAIP